LLPKTPKPRLILLQIYSKDNLVQSPFHFLNCLALSTFAPSLLIPVFPSLPTKLFLALSN